MFSDEEKGLYLVRGENIVLMGEIVGYISVRIYSNMCNGAGRINI